jgi:hypothetical protein
VIIALLPILLSAQTQVTQSTSQPSTSTSEPPLSRTLPEHFTVTGVSAEQVIAEFMNVCFRPMWNAQDIQLATSQSPFVYQAAPGNDAKSSIWKSPQGQVTLHVLVGLSQCSLTMGSIQPRTGGQFLSMLKPAVEAELGHPVSENDDRFYLEWAVPDSTMEERITLQNGSNEPSQSVWIAFDKTAPGVREKLDAMTKQGTAPQ